MKSSIQLFIAIAVLLAAATVTAQVYKWVDKDGRVQYSDTPPPPDAKSEPKRVDTRPAAGAGSVPAKATLADATKGAAGDAKGNAKDAPSDKPKTLTELNKESEKRRTDALDAEKKAGEQAKVDKADQDRCRDATRYLRTLETGLPISTTDDTGERKVLDDGARAAEVAKARSIMNQACK